MKKVNCTSNFLCLIPCAKAALKTVQCAALIAPYVFRQFDGGGGVERHASSAGNKRGDLRPEFFIMPSFKTRRAHVRRYHMVCFSAARQGHDKIEKWLCIPWNSCAQVNCAVPAI